MDDRYNDRDASHHGQWEVRTEKFSSNGPANIQIRLSSGDAVVRTSDTTSLIVRVRAQGKRATQRVSDTRVAFDVTTNQLIVESPTRASGTNLARRLMDFSADGDVDVEIEAPMDSSVDVATASGDATLAGRFHHVDSMSASGDVYVEYTNALKYQAASGDVQAQCVTESLSIKTSSGDVRIAELSGTSKVVCVSGDVDVTFSGAADADLHAVSGDVTVGVREGLVVDVDAKSVSGQLSSQIDLDGSGVSADARATVRLKIGTVSGDVRIRRATTDNNSAWLDRISRLFQRSA